MKYILNDDLDRILEDENLDLTPGQEERLAKMLRNAIRDTAEFDSPLIRRVEEKGKPFCFRCGQEPVYEVLLRHKLSGKVEDGPFWPLCGPCMRQIPWERVFAETVDMLEEQYGPPLGAETE